jgi:hypothetical protein
MLTTSQNCQQTAPGNLTRGNKVISSSLETAPTTLLDTIAQPVHRGNLDTLKRRAKNAFFSKSLARHLTRLDSPLNKAYRRTLFDCGGMLLQEGQKVTGKYCNARWCNNCNRIRTAKLIQGYSKPLEAMKYPYFTTLTIPNVPGEVLQDTIKGMLKTIQLITRSRRRLVKFDGIRKFECTYNAEADNYHPHFHLIVDGLENAQFLVQNWLQRNPGAEHWCQDIREADKGSLIELFKYTTKIVSKSKKGDFKIYIKPLDTIFQAMQGMRTFQPIGSIKCIKEDIDELSSESYDIPFYESVVWQWGGSDWYSMLNGEPLTGYEPSKAMMSLVTEKMVFHPKNNRITVYDG